MAEIYCLGETPASISSVVGTNSNNSFYQVGSNVDGGCVVYVSEDSYSSYDSSWSSYLPTTVSLSAILYIPVSAEDDNEAGTYYATYYNGSHSYVMPDGLTGYTVTVSGNELTLTEAYTAGSTVPAGTALLIKGSSSGTYPASATTGGTETNSNMLYGSDTAVMTTGPDDGSYLFYKLTTKGGKNLGFYWGADDGAAFESAAHKAWLAVPESTNVKLTGFSFADADETTGIKSVEISAKETANIADGAIYTITGQRVNAMNQSGVYIVNGKKVIKK